MTIVDRPLLRDIHFGGPDWVWARIKRLMTDRRMGMRSLFGANHPLIEAVIEFCSARDNPRIPGEVAAWMWPELHNAVTLHEASEPGSLRWHVEALILGGAEDATIAKDMGSGEAAATVACYRLLFFNVDKNKNNPVWMNHHVWSPAMACRDRLYFYNYAFKAAAYFGGLKVFRSFMSPGALDAESEKWLIDQVSALRNREALNMAGKYSKLNPEGMVTVHESTVKRWHEVKERVETERVDDAASMKALVEALTPKLKLIRAAPSEALKEERIDFVEMYTEEDLKI